MQFGVYRNADRATRARVPLLLDVQAPLLDELATRVVVPLVVLERAKTRSLETLTPVLRIANQKYLLMTPQLASVPRRVLGEFVADLSAHRFEIIAALDVLITGV